MDLAVRLGIEQLEIRSAYGRNALLLPDERLEQLRVLASERGLKVAALASPLWKWCRSDARPGRVDSFGFPVRVAAGDRQGWVERAVAVAGILRAPVIRVFSHLLAGELTESFIGDPLLVRALQAANRAGARLLLENEPSCTVANAGALLDVMDRYHELGLGLWLDVANLHDLGLATPEVVRSLTPYVGYVHVKDYLAGDDGGRVFCAAGAGCVPYREVLPLLHAACPVLPCGLETHMRRAAAAAVAAGAAYLRASLPGGMA